MLYLTSVVRYFSPRAVLGVSFSSPSCSENGDSKLYGEMLASDAFVLAEWFPRRGVGVEMIPPKSFGFGVAKSHAGRLTPAVPSPSFNPSCIISAYSCSPASSYVRRKLSVNASSGFSLSFAGLYAK
jgi:hypothetical protein